MVKCFYCQNDVKKGQGVLFVTKKGQAQYYCSSKCKKYNKMGRRKGKWTQPKV